MKIGRRIIALISMAVLVSCGNLKDDKTPAWVDLGTGRIIQKRDVTAQTGESTSANAAYGLMAGGLIGATTGVAFGEPGLGQAKLAEYDVRMDKTGITSFQSFSIVSPDDCVAVTRIQSRPAVVFERLASTACH